MSGKASFQLTPRRLAVVALVLAAAALIALAPAPPGAAPRAMIGLAIVFLTVTLWATNALPAYVAGILFFALSLATGIAPVVPLVSGFWSNAAALVLGGLIIGAAAERTGLGRWVAHRVLGPFMGSFPAFIAGVLLGSGILSFLVPSTMGRLAITIPIVLAACRSAGYAIGSPGHAAAVVTAVAGNYLTSYGILPANLTNVIALGAMEARGGFVLQYGTYLLLCYPVLALLKSLTFWGAVVVLVRAPAPARAEGEAAPALGVEARRLAVIVGITVLLWALDFVHHVKPGWIALAAGILCILPPVGLAKLEESFDVNKLTAVFSLAAVLGVATVLAYSGAGAMIADWLMAMARPTGASPAYGFVVIALAASAVAFIGTVVGAIAIVTPTLPMFAEATGLPLTTAFVALLTGLQTIPLPFQAVPVMVGLTMGKVAPGAAVRVMVTVALLGYLVILPANILWLALLGRMG
jgi:di/tricarboxylate transporter